MWISEQEHLRQFLDGADWFVDNQDDNGGWPSQVRSEQTNNQNVINKSKKNRMNKFFLPGHVQSREQKVSRSGRGCPWVVRCNVSGAKFARKQIDIRKNNFITGSLLIFKDEMLCSVHSNIFPAQGQAISVLVRAHSSTGDTSYLEAATRCVLFLLILIRKLIVDRFANLFKCIGQGGGSIWKVDLGRRRGGDCPWPCLVPGVPNPASEVRSTFRSFH